MPTNERRERLVAAANTSLNEYAAGALPRMPYMRELAIATGYRDHNQVSAILKTEGIDIKIRQAEQKRLSTPYPPSTQLAWLMGYFTEHGSSSTDNMLTVSDSTPETLSKFKTYATHVFNYEPQPGKDKSKPLAVIYSKEITSRLGSVSFANYMQTLKEKYDWIPTDKQFIWSYIEGLIDSKASLEDRRMKANISSEELASYVFNLLKDAGVLNPGMWFNTTSNYWSISINNIRDLKLIALNITLEDPEKSDYIAIYRDRRTPLKDRGKPAPSCTHHWVIQEQKGAYSHGMCKNCAGEKEFKNALKEEENTFNKRRE